MKMNSAAIKFAIFTLSLIVSGCANVSLVDANAKSLLVKEPQTRTRLGLNKVEFPAGVYQPDFQTKEGVYYHAPGHIIVTGLGINQVMRGGLFVPFDSEKKQGFWEDHQESSGGLIAFGATSNKRVFRFSEPIPFEMVTNAANITK